MGGATVTRIHNKGANQGRYVFFSLTKNKFVQLAIEKTVKLGIEVRGATAIQESISSGLDIVIVGDNDFYSQRATVSWICHLIHPLRSSI